MAPANSLMPDQYVAFFYFDGKLRVFSGKAIASETFQLLFVIDAKRYAIPDENHIFYG
jgi:hypothetical protein